MRERPYYSVRTGKNPHGGGFGLSSALRLFQSIYSELERENYLQEAFGYNCVDAGEIYGTLGADIAAEMLLELRKDGLWPISTECLNYSEDDLFDVIEYLYDQVSAGAEGHYHSWGDCGMHYKTFDKSKGQVHYRTKINRLLNAYANGFEIDESGEILTLPEPGFETIHGAAIPSRDRENITAKVEAATYKFRRARSTLDERRDAIRDLVDVLEFLRPQLKQVLNSEDEKDLFNIANNFGIRHHNQNQKTDYDRNIWYSWLFYYYLSTIHAATRLIERKP